MKEIIVGDDTWTRTDGDGHSSTERDPRDTRDTALPPPAPRPHAPHQLTRRAPRAAAHTTRTR